MHLRMTGNLLLRPAGSRRGRRPDGERRDSAGRGCMSRIPTRATCGRGSRSTTARSSGSPTRGASATGSCSPRTRSTPTSPPGSGVEPLSGELTPEGLLRARGRAPGAAEVVSARTRRGIAGIGNIYADEALFRARLHPLSPAGLDEASSTAEELRDGIVDALELALRNRGLVDRRLPRRARRARLDAGRVPRPHPRGRALRALRRDDPADRGLAGARPTSAPAARSGCGRRGGDAGAAT